MQNERSLFRTLRRMQSPRSTSRWDRRTVTAARSFLMMAGGSVYAAKGGGKGKPGGDDPQYMPSFVEYRVTWIDLPAEMGIRPELRDINRDGFAVGYFGTSDGAYRGLLADTDGGVWDLNDVFSDALLEFPGWRFHGAHQINAAGQIAGILVPNGELRSSTAPDVLIVSADLYTDPPSITVVDRILDTGVNLIKDMNEAGDMVVRRSSEAGFWLSRAPYTDEPERIEGPVGAEDFTVGYLNGAGQVTMAAFFNERIYRNRKQYNETLVHHVILREPDGSLLDLGYGPDSWWVSPISEDGVVYTASNGTDYNPSTEGIIHRWDATQGWQPITQAKGALHAGVSKEAGNKGELVIDVNSTGGDERVYREGYGTYKLEVTSGLNGQADVDFYESTVSQRFLRGISRREEVAEAGYICGSQWDTAFILTPVPIQP